MRKPIKHSSHILNESRKQLALHLLRRVTGAENGQLTVLLSAFDDVPYNGKNMRREVVLKNARNACILPPDIDVDALTAAPSGQPVAIDRKVVESLAAISYDQFRPYISNVPPPGPRPGGTSPYNHR